MALLGWMEAEVTVTPTILVPHDTTSALGNFVQLLKLLGFELQEVGPQGWAFRRYPVAKSQPSVCGLSGIRQTSHQIQVRPFFLQYPRDPHGSLSLLWGSGPWCPSSSRNFVGEPVTWALTDTVWGTIRQHASIFVECIAWTELRVSAVRQEQDRWTISVVVPWTYRPDYTAPQLDLLELGGWRCVSDLVAQPDLDPDWRRSAQVAQNLSAWQIYPGARLAVNSPTQPLEPVRQGTVYLF